MKSLLSPVRVAVKILRPRVREQFARDLEALAFFARMAELFSAEARRLQAVLDQYAKARPEHLANHKAVPVKD